MSDELDIEAIEAGIVVWERDELQRECRALLAEVRRLERDLSDSDERGCDAAGDVEELRAEVRRLGAALQSARRSHRADLLTIGAVVGLPEGEADLGYICGRIQRTQAEVRGARVDGARVMREETIRAIETDRESALFRVRALDPAAVVGSGSSIHAALPSPDTYQWSATGPNGCLLLSPADCIVARIDRDGTGWRPQIPGRGPLKWAADFPSAVGQVREVLGDIVPDGSVVVGSGS